MSNVAKHTIEQRLRTKIPNFTDYVMIYNFHELSARILKIHGLKSQIPINYQYYHKHHSLSSNEENIIREEIEQLLENKEWGELHTYRISNRIGILKTTEYVPEIKITYQISYTSVCLLTILLLERENKKNIYQKLYTHIIIDEFQDVTWLQWYLIRAIYNPKKHIIVFAGDEFQSIMRFAGALGKELLNKGRTVLKIVKHIKFQINYRLQNKPEIENFQKTVRSGSSVVSTKNYFTIVLHKSIIDEIQSIITKIHEIHTNNTLHSIIILCNVKNYFWERIELNWKYSKLGVQFFKELATLSIPYIDTLMLEKENSPVIYTVAGEFCEEEYNQYNKISFKKLKTHLKTKFHGTITDHFLMLLDGYYEYCKEYDIPFDTVREILERDELIKYAKYSSKIKITISNIHKAKGAEWDHVFVPFMNKSSFPFYCYNCLYHQDCSLKPINKHEDDYQKLYVAVTRPKEGLYISANEEATPSCLFHHINK